MFTFLYSTISAHKQKNLEFQMLVTMNHKGCHWEYSHTLKWESRFTLGLNAAKILYQKIVEVKVVESWISYKKVSGRTSLSPPGVELGGSKDGYVLNMILHWNGKVDSFLGWRLLKLRIISNNCSNKSCWELNFVQKKVIKNETKIMSKIQGLDELDELSLSNYHYRFSKK